MLSQSTQTHTHNYTCDCKTIITIDIHVYINKHDWVTNIHDITSPIPLITRLYDPNYNIQQQGIITAWESSKVVFSM